LRGNAAFGIHLHGEAIPLGNAKQPGGKIAYAWALRGEWDAAELQSNTFEMEWRPRSGRRQTSTEQRGLALPKRGSGF
jgi:predicted NUDIX family NTP pyrophosphohydrolase